MPAMAQNGVLITLLYDGLCPICRREVRLLRRLDRAARLGFVDIAAPSFDAGAYGLTQQEVIGAMRGVLPDGSIVVGMDVFRRAYAAVGLGWLAAPSGWPVLRWFFDGAYRVFARIRPRFSKFQPDACAEGRCDGGLRRHGAGGASEHDALEPLDAASQFSAADT